MSPAVRPPVRLAGLALLAAAGLCSTGCAMRPGYVDSATGRAYAGFAKPALYCGDCCGMLGIKECDCRSNPYTPPVVAFCSFPGMEAGCRHHRPPFVTTHVYAPPPARYEDFQGHAARFDDRRGPRSAPPAMRDAVPPTPAPMPLPASTDDPFDLSGEAPGLPPAGPDGIGR